MNSTSTEVSATTVLEQVEGEYFPSQSFSDAEILEFMARNTTLHKQVEVQYVVDGYEATVTCSKVTYNDSGMAEPALGLTYRESLVALMLSEKDWADKVG